MILAITKPWAILCHVVCVKLGITDVVLYYENRSFFGTLSGVMKPSPSMGFRCQVSGWLSLIPY
jgi:hypothetical protein